MSVRWLHLSDVHECHTDSYHRTGMYDAIVAEAKAAQQKPDFVFFTGDLAYSGKADEYELLKKRLLEPLRSALPDACFLSVPGNHDVDRTRVGKPRLWMADADEREAFQEIGPRGQRKRTDALLLRFDAYRQIEQEFFGWEDDWLASEQGSACKVVEVRGQKTAIVGINTAWLCQDGEDWSRITAGRYMVEAALDQAKKEHPALLIVLGHHPLLAMMGESEWSDGDRIKGRLEQAHAVYLHGHLHTSGTQRTGDSLRSVLAVQAPSGFQDADNPRWRNGLLWGAADPTQGQLRITPKSWNDQHREYVFDINAAPSDYRVRGEDCFAFSLPNQASVVPAAPGHEQDKAAPRFQVDGWEIVDHDALAEKTAHRPTSEEMGDWFDGQFPRWETALAEGVRPRRIVEDIARRFEAAHSGAPKPLATLLTGAGGEGKSAALLQTAAMLVRGGKKWTCLRRTAAAAGVNKEFFAGLEQQPGHAWIVAIDDAENIGRTLPEALRHIQPRTDVHLVLAARDADWSIRGLTDAIWRETADFRRVTLAGIDAEDARRVADGWVAYGPEAMRRLGDRSAEQAAQALLGHAQDLAAKKDEGALLGALLITRSGEDLKSRVTRLMEPWADAEGIGEHSLRDIYAMIAAMHAENLLYLSQTVLALALGCDEAALERGPLRLLRREAMVDSGTTYVLTRHRRIAETARDWLVETGYNVDRWYPYLAKAARREFSVRRTTNPDIAKWCNELPRHFADGGRSRWPVAVAVAKALFDAEPSDAQRLTVYSSTLRRTEQHGAALELLKREGEKFRTRRDVLYEWSVAAGGAGDHGLNIWLAARSLADDRAQPLDATRCKLSLAGLGAAFRELRDTTGETNYAAAQAICGRLGLMLSDLDPTTRRYFKEHEAAAPPPPAADLAKDIQALRAAVIAASLEVESANDPEFFEGLIGDSDAYRFTTLYSVLAGDDRPTDPRAQRQRRSH